MNAPPPLPRRLLRLLLSKSLADRITDDLDEEWAEYVVPSRSRLRASRWYWHMALRSVGAVWMSGIRNRRATPTNGEGQGERERRGGMGGMTNRLEALGEHVRGVRFAVRSLARDPGLSLSAVSVMALGIAAAAIVFSVLDAVLIRPLPYADPERVVAINGGQIGQPEIYGSVSYPNVADVGLASRTLESVAAGSWWSPAFTEAGRTQVVNGMTVSWNYFALLGLEPAAGRFFQPDEEGEGRPRVAVIGFGLWEERYGSDPDVVGRAVSINKVPYTIVGVTPEGFEDPFGQFDGRNVRIWRTPWFDAPTWFRSGRSWKAIGRLAQGSSVASANQELAQITAGLADLWPEENTGQTMRAMPVLDWVTAGSRSTIVMLAVSVALILLIACANIANLLLARGVRRAGEMSVRVALGASGGHLLRVTLTEALALAVGGGIAGILLAYVGLDLIVSLASNSIPRLSNVSLDGRVLAFCAAASVLTGLTFGVLPGLRNRRLAGGTRTATEGARESRLRRSLVVAEVAVTVVLLFGAGLFLRTFDALYKVDLGVETDRVVTVFLHDSGWGEMDEEAAAAQWDGILDRVAARPEIGSVGAIDIVPLTDNRSCDGTSRADLPPPPPGQGECTEVRVLLPGALQVLGVRVLTGRGPDRRDRGDAPRVVWISDATRQLLWPDGADPLGAGLRIHGEEFAVAGVVGDIRHFGPGEAPRPMIYVTAHQEPWNGIARGLSLVMRGQGSAEGLVALVRSAIEAEGADIPVDQLQTMNELLSTRVTAPRLRVALASGFAVAALLISMVGLAGVLAFSISRRKREIGVRLALGAAQSDIRAMVVREGMALLGFGLALGMLVALPTGMALTRFLYSVQPWDPLSIVVVAVLMFGGMLVATYPSALRASRASPGAALQSE